MGDAARRKAAGTYPAPPKFEEGFVELVGSRGQKVTVYVFGSGHVHRLTIGPRIMNAEVVAAAQAQRRIQPAER